MGCCESSAAASSPAGSGRSGREKRNRGGETEDLDARWAQLGVVPGRTSSSRGGADRRTPAGIVDPLGQGGGESMSGSHLPGAGGLSVGGGGGPGGASQTGHPSMSSLTSAHTGMLSVGYQIKEPATDVMQSRILAKALKSTLELEDDLSSPKDVGNSPQKLDLPGRGNSPGNGPGPTQSSAGRDMDSDDDALSDASSTSAVDMRVPLPVREPKSGKKGGTDSKNSKTLKLGSLPQGGGGSGGLPGAVQSSASMSDGRSNRPDAKEELWRNTQAKNLGERRLPYSQPPADDDETMTYASTGTSRRRQKPETLQWLKHTPVEPEERDPLPSSATDYAALRTAKASQQPLEPVSATSASHTVATTGTDAGNASNSNSSGGVTGRSTSETPPP